MSGATGNPAGGARWDAERFVRERDARLEPRREIRPRGRDLDGARELRPDRRSLFSGAGVQDLFAESAKTGLGHLVPARRPDREYNDKHLEDDVLLPSTAPRRRGAAAAAAADDRDFRRPTLLRRQSSLDRFDLATSKRSHDFRRYDRDDYGPPIAPRKRSSSRVADLKFEKLRISEPAATTLLGEDIARRSMTVRDRSSTPRGRRSSSIIRPDAARDKSMSARPSPKPGTTRIPKHMVAPQALEDLGYVYEVYGEDIVINKTLTDNQVHELIDYTDSLRKAAAQATPPPPAPRKLESEKVVIGAKDSPISIERRRSVSRHRPRTPSPRMEPMRPVRTISPSPRAIRPRHVRRRSSPIRLLEVPDAHPTQLLAPSYRLSERDMRAIATIEGPSTEIVVRRDHKSPTPRLLRAMMATLT